jgi:Fe-S oxidoreductase
MSTCSNDTLAKALQQHAETCLDCGLCVKQCSFLQANGSPKQIASNYRGNGDAALAYECSLCGLCTAVCPPKVGLDPASLFLEMRREAASSGAMSFAGHKRILQYEKRGRSALFSLHCLPKNCDTVLFPGCNLPGTRPGRVKELFTILQKDIPDLGLVLDCCTKPSHDLGRQQSFETAFTQLTACLLHHGVKKVLVACPNCFRVFSQYAPQLQVETVYEHLRGLTNGAGSLLGTVTVHDPCTTRFDEQLHQTIRHLIDGVSLDIEEMPHHGRKTMCCGEGGAVACQQPDLARKWTQRREEQAKHLVVTYCAGCAGYLGNNMETAHLLDLLFHPKATIEGKIKVAGAPLTYLNRLQLKHYFKKHFASMDSRQLRCRSGR